MAGHENILGIEGGGTRTTWALLTPEGRVLARGEAGPGNTPLLGDAALEQLFKTIRRGAGKRVKAIGGALGRCQPCDEQARRAKNVRPGLSPGRTGPGRGDNRPGP